MFQDSPLYTDHYCLRRRVYARRGARSRVVNRSKVANAGTWPQSEAREEEKDGERQEKAAAGQPKVADLPVPRAASSRDGQSAWPLELRQLLRFSHDEYFVATNPN